MEWKTGISQWRNGARIPKSCTCDRNSTPRCHKVTFPKRWVSDRLFWVENGQQHTHACTLCIKFSDCVDRFEILFMLLAFTKTKLKKKGVGGFSIHAHRLLSVRKGVAARERGGWWCAGGSAQLQCRGMRQVARAGIRWWEVGNIFWKEKRGSGEKTLGKMATLGKGIPSPPPFLLFYHIKHSYAQNV